MPASISPTPTYPIPGERVEISFAGLNAATNAVQLFAVTAPAGSALDTRIKESTKNRVRVFDGDTATKWIFEPDKGGVYTFTLEELTRVSPSLGMFAGDLGGTSSPTAVATTIVTLSVGQKLTHQLGTSQDSAELVVFIWGDYVRATTLPVHGIASPAIINPSSATAAAAIEATDVVAAIAALIDIDAGSILGSVATVFASLRDAYQAHALNATHHNVDDDVNTIGDGFVATSPKAAENSINELRRQLAAHMENPTDSGGTTRPHDAVDGANAFMTSGASTDAATHYAALVDAWIVYSGHIATGSPVHNSADVTNTAPTLSPLMTLHRRFFEAIADQSPSPPAATNAGVTTLAQRAGFKEAE